jgi:hypothetical protein
MTHIYSSQAAAAESRLLDKVDAVPKVIDCATLITQNVRRLGLRSDFSFERTVPDDERIVETLWQELERRGIRRQDGVAIISEDDTYYARALCSTFKHSVNPGCVYSYTYLRGIDGKLPSDKEPEREANGAAEHGNKDTLSSRRPTEQTEGLNQADDTRRLAQELQEVDRRLRDNRDGGLKAVGVLGSDVYDKLELLKALRPILPQAVFFTNNLDARLGHPDEWSETHNLVVVSALGLSLQGQQVPPFRHSGQTALFAATLRAMGAAPADKCPHIFEISRNGPKELGISSSEGNWWSKGVSALPKTNVSQGPKVFLSLPFYAGGFLSIGLVLFYLGSEARPITFRDTRGAWTTALTIAAASIAIFGLFVLFSGVLPRLLRIAYFIVFCSGLLAWKYAVSRVPSAPWDTSSQAKGMKTGISTGERQVEEAGLGACLWAWRDEIAASSWLAVPVCAGLTVGLVWCFYNYQSSSGNGEPFAWFDGISAWPSITIILFAGLLSVHFMVKAHSDLKRNASDLAKKFGLPDTIADEKSIFGWERPPLKPGIIQGAPRFPECDCGSSPRIEIAALWQRYRCRGQLWMRGVARGANDRNLHGGSPRYFAGRGPFPTTTYPGPLDMSDSQGKRPAHHPAPFGIPPGSRQFCLERFDRRPSHSSFKLSRG